MGESRHLRAAAQQQVAWQIGILSIFLSFFVLIVLAENDGGGKQKRVVLSVLYPCRRPKSVDSGFFAARFRRMGQGGCFGSAALLARWSKRWHFGSFCLERSEPGKPGL